MSEPIIESSGNVFTDLGFDPAEAVILKMRAELMNDLRTHIQKSDLTSAQVAERLGISRTRAVDLIRGEWDKFSLEMLITLEARAGRRISLDLVA
jgi:predicted XRE-type DNA-binding protein